MSDDSNKLAEEAVQPESTATDTQETAADLEVTSEAAETAQKQVENVKPTVSASVTQEQTNQALASEVITETTADDGNPKKTRKGLVIGVIVALVLVAAGAAYYFLEFSPSTNYQQAVKSMEEKDYASAVATFSSMPEYRDSKSKIYEIYKDIAGQSYIDEATAGVSYMNNYIQAQARDMKSAMLSAYRTGETTWSPDLNDANLKSMEQSASNLKAKKSEFDKVFTPAVIEACGDKTLSDACEQFKELHSATVSLLSSQKAMNYIYEMAQGSTSSMNADVTKVTSAFTPYERTINSMK